MSWTHTPPGAKAGARWNLLMHQMKTAGFRQRLEAAMTSALEHKQTFYEGELLKLNQKIVKDQTELLQNWCQFGMLKAWIYYVNESGVLKEINTEQDEKDIEAARLGSVDEGPITDYLISMGFKTPNSSTRVFVAPTTPEGKARLDRVLSFISGPAKQCSSFSQHWVADANPKAQRGDRQIAQVHEAVKEISKSNQSFFQALRESQRITSILNTITNLQKPGTLQKRVTRLENALAAFDKRMYGATRADIKDQVAGIIRGFVSSPTLYRNSHLSISLTGPPGTGKTSLANFVGEILAALGILIKADTVSIQTRATMVGQYIGETAAKVNNILRGNIEGIIFIDEAYSLAQAGGGDTGDQSGAPKYDPYGVEAINEIVGFLDKKKGQICIITAGYKEEMQKYFFDVNPGMQRRFRWFWNLPPFAPGELFCVMALQMSFLDANKGTKVRDTIDKMVSVEGQTLINSLFHDCLERECPTQEPIFDFKKWNIDFSQEYLEGEVSQEARREILKEKDKDLAYAYFKNRHFLPFREYFQNEGGDTENLGAQLVAAYYQLGRRQLDLQTTLNVVWNYLKQRDGNVLIQRGMPYKAPAQFSNEVFTGERSASVDATTVTITFSKDQESKEITVATKEPEVCSFPGDE
jgi:SpoVK/Ycf46/Vps4 family AAA+-type ATPase